MLTPSMTRRSWLLGTAATAAAAALWRPGAAAADEFAALDATAQADLVARREVTATELVDAAIRRIEMLDPKINAIVSKGYEQARARAAGPLGGAFAGVPYLIKDLIEYPGLPYRAGSRMLPNVPSTYRSDYADRTEDAGLVVLGTSTTPEFGFIPTTEPLLHAPTLNPWNLAWSPGGSSGGAAAAVASGMVPFAHASDGGGSIRIPASCCGLFGLKPSRGRQSVARREMRGLDISVEHCVSHSVRDSARLLAATERTGKATALPPVGLVAGPGKRRLRIGWHVADMMGAAPDTEVARAIEETARLCAELGHELVETPLPFDGEELMAHFKVLWAAGAAGAVAQYRAQTGRMPDDSVLEPFTLSLAEFAAGLPPEAMPAAIAHLQSNDAPVTQMFEKIDLLLTPVLTRPSVPIGYLAPTVPFDELWDRCMSYCTYTPWQNAAGVPAMSVPLSQSAQGLPIGSQFTAGMGGERMLLELAYELELARNWAGRRAPLFGG